MIVGRLNGWKWFWGRRHKPKKVFVQDAATWRAVCRARRKMRCALRQMDAAISVFSAQMDATDTIWREVALADLEPRPTRGATAALAAVSIFTLGELANFQAARGAEWWKAVEGLPLCEAALIQEAADRYMLEAAFGLEDQE